MTLADFERTVAAAQAKNDTAFAMLWRDYQPGLLRYLRVIGGQAAEDLASDTWLRVARGLPTFRGDEHAFRGWLYTIARNRAIDWYRASSRRDEVAIDLAAVEHPSDDDGPERRLEERDATESALQLIATLPRDQAEAVMLRVVLELDVATVAAVMERPPGTVRVMVHRGLRRLAQELESRKLAAAEAAKPAPEGLAV
jgi:RNA polymerase sigma-70 factor (ECF subfamily)